MTQVTNHHPRAGWQEDEIELLFNAIQTATKAGRPLREAFTHVGEQLQRKPNSIRNYYYARVRETPELAPRQTPFRAFEADELHQLLRQVLIGRGGGESVRACVTRLAEGNRSRMLRYQNKYRSILKNRPELLMEVAEELRQEGLPCPEKVLACRRYTQPDKSKAEAGASLLEACGDDPAAGEVLRALKGLLERYQAAAAALKERAETVSETESLRAKWLEARRDADRLRVEVDILKMALEDERKRGGYDAEVDGGF